MNLVYLLLGGNLGDPLEQLKKAKEKINKEVGKIVTSSSIYESEAWGLQDQPLFFNQVLAVQTTLTAQQVLEIIQKIENILGRTREIKWGSRLIDIDILYYNNEVIHTKDLQVPHPYIQERNFTLIPLSEIAENYIHPILKKTNKELLLQSKDPLRVCKSTT